MSVLKSLFRRVLRGECGVCSGDGVVNDVGCQDCNGTGQDGK